MKRSRLREDELRRVVREALPDDLPPELARSLREGLRPHWRRVARSEPALAPRPRPGWNPTFLLPAAALLMIAVGAVLHGAAPPRVLAESLAVRKVASAAALRLAQASAMRCVVEPSPPGRAHGRYRVEWRAGSPSQVWLETAGAAPRTAALGGGRTAAGSTVASDEPPPLLRALLSPEHVARLLDGAWRPAAPPPGAPERAAAFTVSAPDGSAAFAVVLDAATLLPTGVEDSSARPTGWRARCEWELARAAPSPLREAAPGRAR
jgi:hypothetical protein